KMKKRVISALLAAVMVLSLTACGSKETKETETENKEETESTEGYDGPTGEISWCSWGSDAEIEYNQKLSELFMETHPGTTVNFEALNGDYATDVETRYIGGQSPDVIYGHPSTLLKWMQEGMLMDISDIYEENDFLWDEDHYMTNTYSLFQYDGKYFGTVAGADTFVLFYNKTKLDEAGLDYPTADTTWEELAEMAEKTTKRDADGVPTSLGLSNSFGYYNFFPILYAHGGKFLDDMNNPTKVVFDSPETVEALRWLQNTTNGGDFSPKGEDGTYLTGGFAAGEYTFHISGVYDIVYMTGIQDFEWDIAPVPQSSKTEGDTAILTAGYAVSSQTENPDLAKEFVLWLTSDEAQRLLSETGIFTVANLNVAMDPEVLNIEGAPEHHSVRVETVPYGQNLQGQCLCWNEMIAVFDNYVYQLYEGTITPEDCAKAIQEECEVLLEAELGK
ncbi:MAG: ABC transporter substrate-binding protein, partial [Bariatricus sp.]